MECAAVALGFLGNTFVFVAALQGALLKESNYRIITATGQPAFGLGRLVRWIRNASRWLLLPGSIAVYISLVIQAMPLNWRECF